MVHRYQLVNSRIPGQGIGIRQVWKGIYVPEGKGLRIVPYQEFV